jgi:hypothetical protein
MKSHFRLPIHAAWLAASLLSVPLMSAQASTDGCRDLRLTNGRIHTMDSRDSVASSAVIRDGRFADLKR